MGEIQTPAITSWGAEFYTHYKYDKEGKWMDGKCRFQTEAEARQNALNMLSRIINADPKYYLPMDPEKHCRTFPSTDHVDSRLDLA